MADPVPPITPPDAPQGPPPAGLIDTAPNTAPVAGNSPATGTPGAVTGYESGASARAQSRSLNLGVMQPGCLRRDDIGKGLAMTRAPAPHRWRASCP